MAQGTDVSVTDDEERTARDYELWSLLKAAFHSVERDAVTVHLTDEGEERLGAARPAHLRAVRSRLVEPVGDDGAAELAELLRRVVAAGR